MRANYPADNVDSIESNEDREAIYSRTDMIRVSNNKFADE